MTATLRGWISCLVAIDRRRRLASSGLFIFIVLLGWAAPRARAAGPLAVSHVHRDWIGRLNTELTLGGWAFTRDGRHLYVSGRDFTNTMNIVAHLSPDPVSGALNFIDAIIGDAGRAMVLGPDEAQLYTIAVGNVVVFSRDAATGALTFSHFLAEPKSSSSAALVVPSDGRHILTAAAESIAVWPRGADGQLGEPTLVRAADDREADDKYSYPAISALAVSGDGRHVYAVQAEGVHGIRDAILIFERDLGTGALVRRQRVGDGFDDYLSLGSLISLALTPDGHGLLVGSDLYGQGEVVSVRLDDDGGKATRARVAGRGSSGSTRLIAVSPDGELMIAGDNSVLTVWHYVPGNGDLELVQVLADGVDGIDTIAGVDSLAWSPDGRFVYVLAAQDHTVTVLRRRCGDGVLDAGERCDDGNFWSGDGCDVVCRVEPCFQCDGVPSTCKPVAGSCNDADPCTVGDVCASGRCSGVPLGDGTACDDGNACTTGDTCRSGACIPSGRRTCPTCGLCDREVGDCVGMVGRGCRRPVETNTGGRYEMPTRLPIGRFALRGGRKALKLHWTRDDAESASGSGDPAYNGYTVCLLDVTGFEPDRFTYDRQRRRVVVEAHVPSASECSPQSCWRRTDAGGFVYRSARGNPDGVRKIQLGRTPSGGLDLAVTAGGRAFRLDPNEVIALPLTAQIFSDGGACWQGDVIPFRARRSAGR